MHKTDTYDVAIVGGGMIGACLALRLADEAKTTLSIALIEPSPSVAIPATGFDPRVVALSLSSAKLLREVGAWDDIQSRSSAYTRMSVWDEEGTGKITFDCEDVQREQLGHIVENSVVMDALYQSLRRNEAIFHLNERVVSTRTDEAAQCNFLTLSGEREIRATLVIAADGARSPLREQWGFATREWDYQHTAIVTTIRTEKPHQHTAWQCFAQHGPLALLPLTDPNYCSIVWSLDDDVAAERLAMDEPTFCRALTRATQGILGDVLEADERESFPLRQRHSKRYFKPGCVLIGDAAHTVHPLAGQGANMGLYDVEVLAREIKRAAARGLSLFDMSILRRYERQRMPHNLAAMATMEGFKRLFGSDNLAVRLMRNTGMNFFDQQPMLKHQLSKLAAGPFV